MNALGARREAAFEGARRRLHLFGGVEGRRSSTSQSSVQPSRRGWLQSTGDGDAGAVVGDRGTTSGVGDGAEVDA